MEHKLTYKADLINQKEYQYHASERLLAITRKGCEGVFYFRRDDPRGLQTRPIDANVKLPLSLNNLKTERVNVFIATDYFLGIDKNENGIAKIEQGYNCEHHKRTFEKNP
jgi:hypothetical protein